MRIWNRFKELDRSKKLFVALVLGGLVFVVFLSPKDALHFADVEREIGLAQQICERGRTWVKTNHAYLKMDNNKLDRVPVDGRLIKLKLIEYPRVLYFKGGFEHTKRDDEYYCSIKDPRTGDYYYLNYKTMKWSKNMRTRR